MEGSMILRRGEKIHLIVRRRFERDIRRHFVGEVVETSDSCVRAEGYVFVLDTGKHEYYRRSDKRTRIVSLVDAGNIINILPQDAKLQDTKYVMSKEKHLVVTDGSTFTLDINEFGTTF